MAMTFPSCKIQYLLYLVSVCSQITTLILAAPSSSCHSHERSALLQFKQSFLINCTTSWSPNAYPKTDSWFRDSNDTDCCSWDGVECSDRTGYVTGLNLSTSCLDGPFPPNSTLFKLTHLESLRLDGNNFNYSLIPSAIGLLSELRILDLSQSVFSGQIPSEIATLSQLTELDLSWNGDGTFTSLVSLELGYLGLERLVRNLTHLIVIDLTTVDISSPVPQALANLTSLKNVTLTHCGLIGEFPPSIFHLPRLEKLKLNWNGDLTGSLPEFRHDSPLIELSIAGTSFSGEIPPSVGNLAHLRVLWLFKSQFAGTIPSSLGNLTKLTELELAYNDFNGDIPPSLTNITRLQRLGLSHLSLSPDDKLLSSWLSKLDNLIFLDLVSMNLVEIPTVLTNLSNLVYLNLNDNDLSGQIPPWLMNLTQLKYLDLSSNQLTGPIEGISQLVNLKTLYLNFNHDLHGNFETFLQLEHLFDLELSKVRLTFPVSEKAANESVAKLNFLTLESCKLTHFPQFLHNQDKLKQLDLGENLIRGLIPQWFVNVTRDSLKILDLHGNFITGFENHTRVLQWTDLRILLLSKNMIQGLLPIPPRSMTILDVSHNMFVGSIPQQICNTSSLNVLDISFNNLGGRIPDCIGELGYLSVLNMQGNNFHSTIPGGYRKACKLKMINLSQNRLVGTMPRSLTNCTMLQVIDISNNHVNDTFPSWLGSLPTLQILLLGHNYFHGRIKMLKGDAGFDSLRILDVSHNFHTGSLPSDCHEKLGAMKIIDKGQTTAYKTIYTYLPGSSWDYNVNYKYSVSITVKGNVMQYTRILTAFRVIDFSSNNFTGKIPSSIGELRGLQALNLSNNNLDGNIPSSLINLNNLESFDLSNNLLEGEIPQGFVQLTSLEVFNVSNNHLVGLIPQGRQFNTFDNSSFEGNLGLCGSPLYNKCGNANDEPPNQETDQLTNNEDEEDSELIDWIIRSLGCVAGLAVGWIIGKYFITDPNHNWFVKTFGNKRLLKTRMRKAPNRTS